MAEEKERHGCLTVWLVFMIVANSGAALLYMFWSSSVREAYPNAPGGVFPILAVSALFNLACSIALFKWKKWGFWGFCVSSIVGLGINNMLGVGIGQQVFGLSGIFLLYWVLNMGKENKGWLQLE